ncbi:MAG: hypothetical protein V7637_6606 [Mycobacteriales bacterium]
MRLLAAASVVVAGVGLVAVGSAPTGAAPAPPRPAAAGSGPVAGTVRLVTGDLVTVGTRAGRVSLVVQPRARTGLAAQFVGMRRAGEQFLVPAAALPYLGHGLDPGLFDVTRLIRAGRAVPGGRLGVRLTYQAGAPHPSVPGVTLTSTQGDTAEGYLTDASAAAFGAALVARAGADLAHPGSGAAGPFTGLTEIRPADPAAAAAPPLTAAPRQTLDATGVLRIRVNPADGEGEPATFVNVMNVDDGNKAFFLTRLVTGEVFRLPVGNYAFQVVTVDPKTQVVRILNVVDYRLTSQPGGQTLAVDMRAANEPVGASTPKPADFASLLTDFNRTDRNGVPFGFSADTFDGQAPILLAPAPAARVGRLGYSANLQFVSPARAPVPYAYSLAFGGTDGIPTDVHYEVADSDLATIDNTYYADGASGQPGVASMTSALPWEGPGVSVGFPFTTPGRRIDYVAGNADVVWSAAYQRGAVDDAGGLVVLFDDYLDSERRYAPGQRARVEWGRQPVHPGLVVQTAKSASEFFCPACREDDDMRIALRPTDDAAGHWGVFGPSRDTPLGPVDAGGRLRLFAGDTALLDEADVTELDVPAPAASTRFRLLLDQNRAAPWYTTGIRSHTEWGFTSTHPKASTAPAGWVCGQSVHPRTGACAVLPLLTVNYSAPVNLRGVAPGGPTHLDVAVAPTQAAPAATIAAVTVDVSFDDGATWTPATATNTGGGHYRAAFTAPTSGFVTTRVKATDSDGNAISQTITRAYTLGTATQPH